MGRASCPARPDCSTSGSGPSGSARSSAPSRWPTPAGGRTRGAVLDQPLGRTGLLMPATCARACSGRRSRRPRVPVRAASRSSSRVDAGRCCARSDAPVATRSPTGDRRAGGCRRRWRPRRCVDPCGDRAAPLACGTRAACAGRREPSRACATRRRWRPPTRWPRSSSTSSAPPADERSSPTSTSRRSSGPRCDARARRLLREVDVLARAYGWTEPEVLALDDARRAAYLRAGAEEPA